MSGSIFHTMQIPMLFFLLSSLSCKKNSPDLLATIDAKDTITVSEYEYSFEKTFGKKLSEAARSEKRKMLDILIMDHLKYLSGLDMGINKEISDDETLIKNGILFNASYEKYFVNRIFSDREVNLYRKYYNMEVRIQNILIRYEKGSGLTKKQARKKIDSISAVLTHHNFNAIAGRVSEFKHAITGAVLTEPQKVRIGQIPYRIEKEIMRLKPGSISHPIEIQNAFVIVRLVSTEPASRKEITENEMRMFLWSKMQNNETEYLAELERYFVDSLYEATKPLINYQNVVQASRVLSTQREDVLTSDRIGPEVLMTYRSGQITIADLFRRFGALEGSDTATVIRYLRSMCQRELIAGLSVEDGYVNSNEFRSALNLTKRKAIIDRVNAKTMVFDVEMPEDQSVAFYSKNREKYRSAGMIAFSEIYGTDRKIMEYCLELANSGLTFDKIVETVKKEHNKVQLTFKPLERIYFSQKSELFKKAIRLNPNEFSGIFPRKNGGYSIIRVSEKKQPDYLNFEAVKKRVEDDYKFAVRAKSERDWHIGELKRRKVVVYEANLFGLK